MSSVETRTVDADESGMRLDRWFKQHYPGLGFGKLQKLLRTGQVRLDGGRATADTRVTAGQAVRVPPNIGEPRAPATPLTMNTMRERSDHEALSAMLIHEDERAYVLNKPPGLATQGGSGVVRHVDGMLEAWRNRKGEKPRLVHRLDRDTSGVLVVAKSRSSAQELTRAFRKRETRKVYWALVKGVPAKDEGRISNWLLKERTEDGDRMRVVPHGTADADHAISRWRVVEKSGQRLGWLELQPETGRTHQLRIHTLAMGHPIIGDPKYFEADHNWDFPGGIQNRLHLHARRIVVPREGFETLDATAPLPAHMVQSWNLLGLDEAAGDAEEEGR